MTKNYFCNINTRRARRARLSRSPSSQNLFLAPSPAPGALSEDGEDLPRLMIDCGLNCGQSHFINISDTVESVVNIGF